MRTFSLPGISKALSVVCLGTGSHGSAIGRDESFALLDAFAERGGTFLDTAHVYADWIPGGAGASERTVGAWIARRGVGARFVVGTKGGHPRLETMQVSRLRPEDIARDLDESRERLQLSVIDLYWLHRDDPAVPVGEILDALNVHLSTGHVRAIGASNWSTARLGEAEEYAGAHGLIGFCASQIAWSLARAEVAYDPATGMVRMDGAALDDYRRSGLRVIPYSAQAGGSFARPWSGHDPVNARRWERAQVLARERGVSATAIALAYLLTHPCGGAGIVGSRTVAQVEDSCGAAAIDLSAEERRHLEG